jgi:hypothetical protein
VETTTAGTGVLDETSAKDYYKRAGFGRFIIRDRPRIRDREYFVQITPTDLQETISVELTVYPELAIRSVPWRFYGRVVRIMPHAVIMFQLSGRERGTLVTIPRRYFDDGRVYLTGEILP